MKKLLITAVLAISSLAQAEDARIGVHLGSYHFSSDGNNVNPGIYGVVDGWTAGTFYNSKRRQSFYGGYTWESDEWKRLSAAVTLGLITGYGKGATPYPMVIPSIGWRHGLLGKASVLRIMFVPRASHQKSHALHASMEWKF